MTAGYFLGAGGGGGGGGGEGGNLPPLDCCLLPLHIGSNNSVLYFPKDATPPRPPYHRLALVPPFKISLEKTLIYLCTCIIHTSIYIPEHFLVASEHSEWVLCQPIVGEGLHEARRSWGECPHCLQPQPARGSTVSRSHTRKHTIRKHATRGLTSNNYWQDFDQSMKY